MAPLETGVNIGVNELALLKVPVPPLTIDQVPDVTLPLVVPARVAVPFSQMV